MRKIQVLSLSVLTLSVLTAFCNTANTANVSTSTTIPFVNNTPFYLELVTQSPNDANCPVAIPSDASPTSVVHMPKNAYCGYDACSSPLFASGPGCEEVQNGNTNNEALTQGGYATYFGVNTFGSTPACSIAKAGPNNNAAFIPYQCSIDSNGNFSLGYLSIAQTYTDPSAPNFDQPVTIPAVTKYTSAPYFRGINISGLEYDGSFLDALFQHPDLPDVQYFAAQGMNFVRLPIRAEYVFGDKNPFISTDPNPLDPGIYPNNMYLTAVYDTVQKYLASGISVDLDLHNYMRFCPTDATVGQGNEPTAPVQNKCSILTANQLAAIWNEILTTPIQLNTVNGPETVSFSELAQKYAPGNSNGGELIFGIMNEPFSDTFENPQQDLTTAQIFANEVAAIKAIRASAPDNLILLSGNGWDPLHAWLSPTTENSTTFTQSALQAQGLDTTNLAIEVHQYFDSDYSGRSQTCNHYANYQAFLQDMGVVDSSGNNIFGAWMQANQMKVMLTEFGAADKNADGTPNVDCQQDMKWMLQYVQENAYNSATPQNGGFIGWAAWRANRNDVPVSAAYPYNFNFLDQGDTRVYGAPLLTKGILPGSGNGLMADVFAEFLTSPATSQQP